MKKVVTNSGDQDATVVYLYDGQKIIQISDGSGNMVQSLTRRAILRIGAAKRHADPVRHGESRIMVRVKDKGDLYVHQDANWNVIGLTDLGHHLVEHYKYSPYGELTVDQDTGYGDRDGDGTVNSTDKGTAGVTCTGTVSGACRILDLDFDGDYDSTDATKFDSLAQGLQRRPGKQSTGVSQPFAHQSLLFEPEIASYQNRARQYDPAKRRFDQRDPLALGRNPSHGYDDGLSLYNRVGNNALLNVDTAGKECDRNKALLMSNYTVTGDEQAWAQVCFARCCICSLQCQKTVCHPAFFEFKTTEELLRGFDLLPVRPGRDNEKLDEINLSGHQGYNDAPSMALDSQDLDIFYIDILSAQDRHRIEITLKSTGVLKFHSCYSAGIGDGNGLVQLAANEIKHTVCGCTIAAPKGPCPESAQVCRDPTGMP